MSLPQNLVLCLLLLRKYSAKDIRKFPTKTDISFRQKRLTRLMKAQDDAEKAAGTATNGTTSATTTSTTIPRKASRGSAKKSKTARTGGDEAEDNNKRVKPTPKKRKMAATKDVEDGNESGDDGKSIEDENES